MKNNIRVIAVVLLSILLTVYLSSCKNSSGEESVTDRSAEFLQLMYDLDNQALHEQVSDKEFLTQWNKILDQIDNVSNGPALFQEYLETEILGYDFIQSSVSKISNIYDDFGIRDIIKVYIRSYNFDDLSTDDYWDPGHPDFTNEMISLSIVSNNNRDEIIEKYKTSDPIRYHNLMKINARNPGEASRRLLYLSEVEIPDNLRSISSGCFRNCDEMWLGVSVSPYGGGTVTGSGIDYPGTGTGLYPLNTPVTLTASPADGYYFMGWTGPCSGREEGKFNMDGDEAVVAYFSSTLTWNMEIFWLAAGRVGQCNSEFTIPLSGGSGSGGSCGDASGSITITESTISVGGFGEETGWGYVCSGDGGGTSWITESDNDFSGQGEITGTATCEITTIFPPSVTTELYTITGSFVGIALKESP